MRTVCACGRRLLVLLFAAALVAALAATAAADEATSLTSSAGAPVLSVSAQTVQWQPVGLETGYGVAVSTAPRGSAERVTHYYAVPRVAGETQSYALQLEAGETVYVGVSADGGLTWSAQEVAVTGAAPEPPPTAPVLSVVGNTVQWHPLGAETSYGVAVSSGARGSEGRVTHYYSIARVAGETQSYTPTLAPGETVYVGVSADGGLTWSAQEAAVTGEPEPAPEPTPEPAPEPEPVPETTTPPAPVLSVQGDTVTWTALPGVTSYTFATVRNPTTTRETTYTTVTGTSYTPPAVPGQTVNYGLAARTPVGGPWAKEVSITYPAAPSGEGVPGTLGNAFVRGVDANLQGWGLVNLPEIVGEIKNLGVNWEREDLSWESVEPVKGVFEWSRFDQVVYAAKERGITLLPIVGYAPAWTSPTNATAYAEFVAAAVRRYGPGTRANLQWWELWNEPYFAYAWSGHTPEPEAYARDALAAAKAAKTIAPSIKLLLAADDQGQTQAGGLTSAETSWVASMFAAAPELGKWIDGVSVHPYGGDPALALAEKGGYRDTSGSWGFARIDTIREQFLAHGADLPFWITEEGWSTWDNSEETVTHRYRDLFPAIRARSWVRALFPFGLREGTATPTNDQPGFGLLRFGTWAPKTSWSVIQAGFTTLG